jgi:hypothetical protein
MTLGVCDFGRGRHENLSGAISWFTFFAEGAADFDAKSGRIEAEVARSNAQASAESEELSLFRPSRAAAAASGALAS